MSSEVFEHPCLSCGACCATYRVTFAEKETRVGHRVPLKEVEELGRGLLAMRGTNKKHRPACECLGGRVGKRVSCRIYENRPSPCREFDASYERGVPNERCDQARRRHGLPPLTKLSFARRPKELV